MCTQVTADYNYQYEEYNLGEKKTRVHYEIANKLKNKKVKAVADILALYEAEKSMGAFIRSLSVDISDSELFRHFQSDYWRGRDVDVDLYFDCIHYMRPSKARFRIVDDGWKGEANFWEPDTYWLDMIVKTYPDSIERWKIEWDIDYKNTVREFTFNPDAKGKSCEAFYMDIIKEWPEFKEFYSDTDISNIIKDCNEKRTKFGQRLNELSKKYEGKSYITPHIKKLREIDPKTVVSSMPFSIC